MLGALILFLFALAGDVLLEAPASDCRLFGSPAACCSSSSLSTWSSPGLRGCAPRACANRRRTPTSRTSPSFLAIPLLAGPGAITTVLLFTGGSSPGQVALFIAVLFVILLLTLSSLLLAPRVMRLFGETGANVLSRVLGVLLAALAVQFVIDGLQASIT